MRKSRGPRHDPCGTLHSRLKRSERDPSMETPVQEFRGNNPPYTFATDILVFFM